MKAKKPPLLYPTAGFAGLLFVLAAMWYAASSQNSAAVYLLLFALLAVFLVSIPHTLINLAGVTITLESAKPSFAGQEVSLPVEMANTSRRTRYGIELALSGPGNQRERIDRIPPGKAARLTLRFPALQRGEHKTGVLRLTSAYPLGFIRASKKFVSSQTYLVYPRPAGHPQLPASRTHSPESWTRADFGEGDDFSGVRAYIPGESQRHIDWKAVARGQPFMTKQFVAEAEAAVHLDFATLRLADVEERLSQLALWVIEAERARRPYSLRLPATYIQPSFGQSHFHQCLRALSLF
ncbi:MAG TPA: DUF58 domain-containing protein [Candidatus Udaeobacter sp.]